MKSMHEKILTNPGIARDPAFNQVGKPQQGNEHTQSTKI